jgi:hypothetical protein
MDVAAETGVVRTVNPVHGMCEYRLGRAPDYSYGLACLHGAVAGMGAAFPTPNYRLLDQ